MPLHKLEESLLDAINKGDVETVDELISLFKYRKEKRQHDATLDVIDDSGKSALFIALDNDKRHILESSRIEIAKSLFNELRTNHKIISAVTTDHQTLFHVAAKNKHYDILKELVEIVNTEIRTTKAYPWASKDVNGNTPLHYACTTRQNAQIIELLVTEINKHKKSYYHLNSINIDGNTPLHLACANGLFAEVIILIKAGANPEAIDDKKLTPFELIPDDKIKEALRLFALENIFANNSLPKIMREQLQIDDDIKQAYLIGIAVNGSLKQYLAAKITLDDQFAKAIDISSHLPNLPQDLINDLESTKAKIISKIIINKADDIIEEEIDTDPYSQLLLEDRDTLIKLINDTQDYADKLNAQPRTKKRDRALAVIIPCIIISTYVLIEVLLNYCPEDRSDGCHLGQIIFGVLGALVVCILSPIIALCLCFIGCPTITRDHVSLTNDIENNFLTKLENLEERRARNEAEMELYLSIPANHIQELREDVNDLKHHRMFYFSQLERHLGRIQEKLQAARRQIALHSKPFTFFNKNADETIIALNICDENSLLIEPEQEIQLDKARQKEEGALLFSAAV